MPETSLTFRTTYPVSANDLFEWHKQPGAFQRLTPPWQRIEVKEAQGGIDPGDSVRLRASLAGPIGFDWSLTHEALSEGLGFADVQVRGPFASWRHEHRFIERDATTSVLEDHLTFTLPVGGWGQGVAGGQVRDLLDRLFSLRHTRTGNDLVRHKQAGVQPMKIAITGSSGLVGGRLIPFLQGGGHEIVKLVRREAKVPDEVSWDPSGGTIDVASLEGVDAIVHLAGVSIAGGRWTDKRKSAIRDSRIDGTSLIAGAITRMDRPPSVLVSTSAVGFYGDRGDTVLTEDAPMGEGFLAEVCRDWENASKPAEKAGTRVVNPRFGIVMAGDDGMLPLLAKVFKFGIGGKLGSGDQYMSWIALDDLIGILLECLANEQLSGPVNAVSPQAVTNAEFTKTMGTVLKRPTVLPVPAFAARMVGGELADELILASQRVTPQRLAEVGFAFDFASLEDALRFELGKPQAGAPHE